MAEQKESQSKRRIKKYTIEEVREYFKEHDCKLLSKVYKNNRTKLDYICSCGNKAQIMFDSFKQGRRCKKCGYKRSGEKIKLDYLFVKKAFENSGCTLLSTEYKDSKTKLDYICSNGHYTKITWNMFQRGQRCIKCRDKLTGERRHISFKRKKEEFEKEGCVLISEEKVNRILYLNYICECGNKSKITWGSFKLGHRCLKCGHQKTTEARRIDYNTVKNIFENAGCKLISKTYENSNTPLKFLCSCGTESKITLYNFSNGSRCSNCSKKRSRGERKIQNILKSMGIEYFTEYQETGCADARVIPFDFAIKKENKLLGLIEYDGIQHFKPIEFFGGYKNLKETKRHDQLKNEYCDENNIPLLRIPYTEFNNIYSFINSFLVELGVT